MTRDEFVKKYTEIVEHTLNYAEKARREGLLALEDALDQEKRDSRDIFEYGISFVVDGADAEIVEKILSNIIEQEKDEDLRTLKTIQKEAVLQIQYGTTPMLICAILNSYTDITIKEDKTQKGMA